MIIIHECNEIESCLESCSSCGTMATKIISTSHIDLSLCDECFITLAYILKNEVEEE